MAKHGIRIVPTQYVINSLSSEPIRVNNVSASAVLGQLPIRPTHSLDIPPHSASFVKVELINTPPNIANHVYGEFAISLPGQPTQVSHLSHDGTFKVQLINNTQMLQPISHLDQSLGFATPYVEFLNDQNSAQNLAHTVGKITTEDTIGDKFPLTADLQMAEDGISTEGHVAPGPIVPPGNLRSIVMTGAGWKVEEIPCEPCNQCKARGEGFTAFMMQSAQILIILFSMLQPLLRLKC